mgnify:CR=1 FL=1
MKSHTGLELKFLIKYVFKHIYPIETNDISVMYLQFCIYMLKTNGICAILLPDDKIFDRCE